MGRVKLDEISSIYLIQSGRTIQEERKLFVSLWSKMWQESKNKSLKRPQIDCTKYDGSFGAMKDELQFTRGLRNAHEQIYGESRIEKRETNKDRAESAPENNGEPAPKSEIETLENEIQALYKQVARLETKQRVEHWKFKAGLNRYPQNEMPMPKDLVSALKVISEYFEKYRDILELLFQEH